MNAESNNPFPLVEGTAKGYDPQLVDEFLQRVKRTYEGVTDETATVTSALIRQQAFPLTKRGYDPRFIDAALDRLEEVLFERERRAYIQAEGVEEWEDIVAALEREIETRLLRETGRKFRKRSIFAHGYRKAQVDALMDQLKHRFANGAQVSTAEIRAVKFHVQLGGYCESQVDAFLDSFIEYLLAKR